MNKELTTAMSSAISVCLSNATLDDFIHDKEWTAKLMLFINSALNEERFRGRGHFHVVSGSFNHCIATDKLAIYTVFNDEVDILVFYA